MAINNTLKPTAGIGPLSSSNTTYSLKPPIQTQTAQKPLVNLPQQKAPAVNYGNLENRGGTIYNKSTGTGYSTPEQLAKDLGINSSQIQWGNIGNAIGTTKGVIPLGTVNQANKVDYGQLENRGGTIYNTQTGQGYKTPQELATAMGTTPDKIQWGNINQAGTTSTAPVNAPVANIPGSTPQPNFTPGTDMYGNIVSGLANTAVGTNPTTAQASQNLLYRSTQPTSDYTQAMQQAEEYNRQLGESRTNEANALAANATNPIPLEFQQGRGNISQNQYLAQQNALASQFTGATNLLNAANTQQGLQQGAATSAAGIGTAQQGLAQTGLDMAAGFAQPQLGGYGQGYYSPVTGQMVGGQGAGGALNPLNNIQSIAQQVISGQISPSQAYSMGGNVANWQGALNQELQRLNPGFDTAQAEGAYSAKQQSTTTLGTAGAGTAADLIQQSNTLQSVLNGADANFRLLIDTAKQGQVLDSNVPVLNTLSQNVKQGLVSDAAVIQFRTTLAEVRNQYANILGGGTATDMSRGIANEQIPDNISLSSLQSLYTQMTSAAKNRITGINEQINRLKNQTSGGGSTGNNWNDIFSQ